MALSSPCGVWQVVYDNGDRKWHMLKRDKKFKVVSMPAGAMEAAQALEKEKATRMKRPQQLTLKQRPKLDSTVKFDGEVSPH